jgi:hypothetical protein
LAVVADGVDWAGFESFVAERFLFRSFWLFEHKGMLSRRVAYKVLGSYVAAYVTVYTLPVDIVWARVVIRKL